MKEQAFLQAVRAALVGVLTLVDARLETLLGQPPAASAPTCPECGKSAHVADAGGGEYVCGDCDHNWEL